MRNVRYDMKIALRELSRDIEGELAFHDAFFYADEKEALKHLARTALIISEKINGPSKPKETSQ